MTIQSPLAATPQVRRPRRVPFSLATAALMLLSVLALMALVPLWPGFDPVKQSLFFALDSVRENSLKQRRSLTLMGVGSQGGAD